MPTETTRKSIVAEFQKRNNNADQLLMNQGRIPPQAVDLEEVVLGAMMLEKEAVNAVIDILSPEAFYK